eukprot:g33677.t2
MKQAFRVFHRIANVMAGVGDCPEMARTAEERAAEETVFWDEKLMRQEANLLDDMAYEDQLQQQMMFFSFNGIEGMDRSIAVELQQQARAYLEELMSHVSDSDEVMKDRGATSAQREVPETVEMEDTEIPRLGSKGDQLLKEVFTLEGWKQLNRPMKEDDDAMVDVNVSTSELPADAAGSHLSARTSGIMTARQVPSNCM